mgnify:FL=1|jgi:hypothetical protein
MIKVISPMKRRLGMSVEDFRKYYENNHRIIGEKYLEGFAIKYIRRYTNPLLDRSGNLNNPEFDVLLEIWYPDMETFEACKKKLSEPDVIKEIREDEEKLFDTTYMRSYIVDEYQSEI